MATKQNAKKRGNGEGSIDRLPNGTYRGRIGSVNADGRYVRKPVYGKTQSEVRDKLRKLQGDAARGRLKAPSTTTAGDWLWHWLNDIKRPQVKKPTFEKYEADIRLRLVPALGNIRLERLTKQHVSRLFTELQSESEVSASIVRHTRAVLKQALDEAVDDRLIDSNPVDRVKGPRMPQKEMKYFTADEATAFLRAAEDCPAYELFVLAITTGMRAGELYGLQWGDADLSGGVLHIRRQIQKGEVVELKTGGSRRRIDLAPEAVEALKRKLGARIPLPTDWVFPSGAGTPLSHTNVRKNWFLPTLDRAGLKPIRFHDLRHTAASLLLAAGVNVKVVSELLGHANIRITLETYAHVMPGQQQDATAILGRLVC